MQRRPLHRLLLVSGALLGASVGQHTPWPYGAPPTASELDTLVADALRLAGRERLDELSAARVLLEEREPLFVSQADVDAYNEDKELIFLMGDEVFAHEFRESGGLGGLIDGPPLRRVHRGASGGLDTFSCAGCHTVGGADGAGAFTQGAFLMGDGERLSSAAARNPPALLGAGLVQALGAEMTAALQGQRAAALERAEARGEPVEAALTAKGVAFGRLVAYPDGRVDAAAVQGVDPDLVVRPFGWKGDQARLRRFVEEAARLHFGAQTAALEQAAARSPDPERYGDGPAHDPDGDGVSREIEGGSLSATAAYLAMLEAPVIAPPSDPGLQARWAAGSRQLSALGCDGCHVRTLKLDDRTWEELPDGAGEPIVLNLLADGEQPRGIDQVPLFSDLKRHDMGPGLADAIDAVPGIPRSHFLTRPLWGLAETAPYLHDGRALTLPDAILAHGGEAQGARDAFAALPPADQADLTIYLLSLTRQPKVRIAR